MKLKKKSNIPLASTKSFVELQQNRDRMPGPGHYNPSNTDLIAYQLVERPDNITRPKSSSHHRTMKFVRHNNLDSTNQTIDSVKNLINNKKVKKIRAKSNI